jgi:hypothetical protein
MVVRGIGEEQKSEGAASHVTTSVYATMWTARSAIPSMSTEIGSM